MLVVDTIMEKFFSETSIKENSWECIAAIFILVNTLLEEMKRSEAGVHTNFIQYILKGASCAFVQSIYRLFDHDLGNWVRQLSLVTCLFAVTHEFLRPFMFM